MVPSWAEPGSSGCEVWDKGLNHQGRVFWPVPITFPLLAGEMAGAGQRKGKKDDNGIGTAIDFVLANARLVLGVGGAAMLGIATLAVKRVSATAGTGHGSGSGEGSARSRVLAVSWVKCKHWVPGDANSSWFRCTTEPSVLPAAPPA